MTPHFCSYFMSKSKLHATPEIKKKEKCYHILYTECERELVVLLTSLMPFSIITAITQILYLPLFFSLLTKERCGKLVISSKTFCGHKMIGKMIFQKVMKWHFSSLLPHIYPHNPS